MYKDMELIVKKYYDDLEEGKIMGCKCGNCGYMEYPPRIICNVCGSQDMEPAQISGKGKVVNCWTAGFSAQNPDFLAVGEYGMGQVEIEEGTTINALVYGINAKNVTELRSKLPLPVEAVLVQRAGGYKAVAFKLVEE